MRYILNFILNIIDFSHKKKIIKFLKKSLSESPLNLIDVGAHYGETLKIFVKNLKIKQLICYEASKENFPKLEKIALDLKKKNFNIKVYNKALGDFKRMAIFNQTSESSSSTFSKINLDTAYFKRKKRILNLFFNKDYISDNYEIELNTLNDEMELNKIQFIDLIKIDTEGFEFEILKGLGDKINLIKYIYFEHHFDLMIVKNYTFRDINQLLKKAGFEKVFKTKMPFRKTFEYIYANKRN